MVQIIQRSQREPSIAERFAESFGSGIGAGINQRMAELHSEKLEAQKQKKSDEFLREENEVVKNLIGKDISGIRDPKVRQEFISSALQGENIKLSGEQNIQQKMMQLMADQSEKDQKKQQEIAPYKSGLDTLARMRQLRSAGNLGRASSALGFLDSDVRKDRGEYEQLGKSLISLASTIPIRNQREFETLSENLYNPNLTDAEAEGILNAMERILSSSAQGISGIENTASKQMENSFEKKTAKKPLSSFHGK